MNKINNSQELQELRNEREAIITAQAHGFQIGINCIQRSLSHALSFDDQELRRRVEKLAGEIKKSPGQSAS